MALDGVTLAAIKTELQNKLIGGRVDKIYQPKENLLTIRIRQPGENIKLLISANPQNPRIHITEQDFDNPYQPPTFCMLLRKHLQSGRIKEINQPNFERILEIIIQYKNNQGELVDKKLVIELMGRHSNIILTKPDEQILDCIKRVTKKISRYRELLPGKDYNPPPQQGKKNPLTADFNQFKEVLSDNLNKDKMYRIIMNNYRGIGPLIGQEIVHRAGFNPQQELIKPKEIDNLWSAFNDIFNKIKNEKFNPTLVLDKENNLKEYEAFKLKQFDLPQESFTSVNQLLDYYFTNRIIQKKVNRLTNKMNNIIRDNIENIKKKYSKVRGQLKGAKNADKHQLKGELITANIYQLEKGQNKVTLQNYYNNNQEVTIELDPELTPAENAQRYFEKYEKAKKSVKYLRREAKKAKAEFEYLQQVEVNINQSETLAELQEIEKELVQEGYIKEQKQNNNKQNDKLPPLKFASTAGYDILVGRNNRQNDGLTKKIANNQDTWVHVKDLPGSHTIIRNHTGKKIPEETLLEAAQIAAFYSKGRKSSNVPVDYTKVKYVKKAKGAKPGMVYYENQNTLYVTPDKNLVEQLKKDN
ncbi:putative RNA-binding protein, snRNP like protein [Halobacteroides halobius DSM 5150]|uniref:Rqc2 homolog RqcH n=1 Tax=Halobacteroides halobius (strain ATCC 35273 / DSM 5150 / MD-1) TaxID=748449 RepID=L0K958_HALHC|nr:NFACT RNA binding domain-containing protein [Halobacteroides halobius]AGB40884.1 putative RNA-binding protein, snRNP like protein [Halobacteroides halobius DSM 5150]